MSDFTADYLLDKQIRIFQPVDGYRASTDAVFLSSLVSRVKSGEQILDVGSGTGAVSLCLAHRFPQNEIIGLELQPRLAELSNQSAAANGFTNLQYLNFDIRQTQNILPYGSFHHVISNPPYSDHDMPSPNQSKATAHNMQQQFSLSNWIDFMLKMLRPQGYFYMVNRTEALDDILCSLYKKAGAIHIVPLYSKQNQTAKRILIKARKQSKAPTEIGFPLIVHNKDGSYSETAHRVLRLGESLF